MLLIRSFLVQSRHILPSITIWCHFLLTVHLLISFFSRMKVSVSRFLGFQIEIFCIEHIWCMEYFKSLRYQELPCLSDLGEKEKETNF